MGGLAKQSTARLAALFGAALLVPVEATGQRRAAPASAAATLNQVELAIRESWPDSALPQPAEQWRARLAQDEIMRVCSQFRNKPPRRIQAAIQRIARTGFLLPGEGIGGGDWQRGQRIAQDGSGQRFTDPEPARPNGGNCYACHQLDKAEVAYGTLGPSLQAYGRLHDYSAASARKVYEHIFNPHMHTPCSIMPRFGAAGTLTAEQIRDLVALLMDRDSPVNR